MTLKSSSFVRETVVNLLAFHNISINEMTPSYSKSLKKIFRKISFMLTFTNSKIVQNVHFRVSISIAFLLAKFCFPELYTIQKWNLSPKTPCISRFQNIEIKNEAEIEKK